MKYKTIKIENDLHTRIKKVCKKNGTKLNWWCNLSLMDTISDQENDKTWIGPFRGKLSDIKKKLLEIINGPESDIKRKILDLVNNDNFVSIIKL